MATIHIVGASRVRRVDRLGPLRLGGSLAHGDAIESYLTPEGYLRCAGRISGCGVYQYDDGEGDSWGELRVPEEVFAPESLASWDLRPVTDAHPNEWITTETIAAHQRGQVGTTWTREGDYLRGEILITDAALIDKIRAGTCELSCGYDARVVQDPGELDGVPYAHRQTEIRGNHVAVVDVARGGPECRLLLDGAMVPRSRRQQEKDTMEQPMEAPKPPPTDSDEMAGPMKIMIGNSEYEVPAEVAAYVAELEGMALGEVEGEDSDEPEPAAVAVVEGGDQPTDKVTVTSSDSAEAKRAREDAIEKRALERADLVLTAARVCGLEYASGNRKSDSAIQLDVIGAVLGSDARTRCENSASADYTRACFDSALEQHAKRVDSTGSLLHATGSAQLRVEDDGGFAAAAAAHNNRVRNGYRSKKAS